MRSVFPLLTLGVIGVVSQQAMLVDGFTPASQHHQHRPTKSNAAQNQNAAKRTPLDDAGDSTFSLSETLSNIHQLHIHATKAVKATAQALLLAVVVSLASAPSSPALAADFAGKTISGQDFSGQDLSGQNFNKAIAQGTNFRNANLQGANFQFAKLEKADFSGANLQNAKFEDAALDGTIMKDVVAQRASFSKTILDIGDLENADLTQSLWPSTYTSSVL